MNLVASFSHSPCVCFSNKFYLVHKHIHVRTHKLLLFGTAGEFLFMVNAYTNIYQPQDRYTHTHNNDVRKFPTKMNGMAKQLNPNPNPYNDSHLTLNITIVAVIMSSVYKCAVYASVCVLVCVHVKWSEMRQIEKKTEKPNFSKYKHKQENELYLLFLL